MPWHNARMCHVTSSIHYPILFPLHPLFLTAWQWSEHSQVSALSLGSTESLRPCFCTLKQSRVFSSNFSIMSHFGVSVFSALNDVMLITMGNKLAGNSLGTWHLGKNQDGLTWLTPITASSSLPLNQKFPSSSPLPIPTNRFPILYFPSLALGRTWARTDLIALDVREAKRKKGRTGVRLSLALQFWPALKARHVSLLIIHLGNCNLWANSPHLPVPLAAHLTAAGGWATWKTPQHAWM